jgi:polyphenol oxidase
MTPDWPAPKTVRALSTFRGGGVSAGRHASLNLGAHVGDDPSAVAENRRQLVAAAALPAEPSWLDQVHGVQVADLDLTTERRPADAAVTRQPGRVCAILTADCLPLLLTNGAVVAAAHAGWRGLADGVIEAVVRALAVEPATLMAWLGPAIGPMHFEVGGEVRDRLLAEDPHALDCFQPNVRGRFMADLPHLARRRLERLGVRQIYGGGECTFAREDRYFSHRRDGASGRQATLIWLENKG